MRGGRLYGRGAADDKAGIMAHIGALRAIKEAVGDDLDLGVVLFIEGEEEAGSLSFAQFLADNADALRADVIVVADSGNWDARTPALTVSLRGNAQFTLRVRTLDHASHSGMFGGAVPDAMMATLNLLVDALGRRRRRRGRGPDRAGCGDPGVHRGDPARRGRAPRACARSARHDPQPHLEQAVDHRHGHRRAERANASNTLSPEITVVMSTRVAPGQDAREAFAALEAHLRAHAPFGAELEFSDSTPATPSSSTRAAGPSPRPRCPRRRLRRRPGRHRASAARSRSSRTWCGSSPAPRSS